MKTISGFLLRVILAVTFVLLFFNIITPFIGRIMPNQFARGDLILDSLRNENFHPEIVVFGSSVVETGINGYVLRNELANDHVYNLAGLAQSLEQICGYFPFLPSTVKTIILGVKINEFGIDSIISSNANSEKSLEEQFEELLSSRLDESKRDSYLIRNFKSRGCLQSGIQIKVREIIDDDAPGKEANNIVYPYLYPTNRTQATYERDIASLNQDGNPLIGKVININYINLLSKANRYFGQKGIEFIVFLSPKSPDINFISDSTTKKFLKDIESNLPRDLKYVNCFYSLNADDFYDGEHPNRIGAEKLSKIVSTYIKSKNLQN